MPVHGAIVIGAGQAGLAASYHLTQAGIDHVVLERGRIGETWRSQRWDTFVLNTPGWLSHVRPADQSSSGRFGSCGVPVPCPSCPPTVRS